MRDRILALIVMGTLPGCAAVDAEQACFRSGGWYEPVKAYIVGHCDCTKDLQQRTQCHIGGTVYGPACPPIIRYECLR